MKPKSHTSLKQMLQSSLKKINNNAKRCGRHTPPSRHLVEMYVRGRLSSPSFGMNTQDTRDALNNSFLSHLERHTMKVKLKYSWLHGEG